MFIPSIDAMWCECLTFFYKIGFSSFSTRSIARGLKFERNEFHVFNRVIRQVEMCRYFCCSVSVTRVICGLSVFGESRGWKRNNGMLIIPLFQLKNSRYSIIPGTKRSLFRSTKSTYSAKISLTYLRVTESRLKYSWSYLDYANFKLKNIKNSSFYSIMWQTSTLNSFPVIILGYKQDCAPFITTK